jgi:hypothetical protein
MQVVAAGPNGLRVASSAVLFDIPAALVCTHFIPLRPGETFMFAQQFNAGVVILALSPGSYELVWPYAPSNDPSEAVCTAGSWPIWRGPGSTQPIRVTVGP